MKKSGAAHFVGYVYLVYLALLPAVGTVALTLFEITVQPFLFFIIGTAAVGIYLAVVVSYTKLSKSVWKNLFILLDGPIWIGIASFFGGSVAGFLFEGVFMELISILLGIFLLSIFSGRPTKDQRIGSLMATGIPLLGVIILAWMYINGNLLDNPMKLFVLGLATLQGTVFQYRIMSQDKVLRESMGIIIFGIIIWVTAFFISVALSV